MILITATGQQYALRQGENLIGRGSDCNFVVASERASRHHALIRWDGHRATIMDLGSTNGTRLNDRRLEPNQPGPLNVGDRLELGGPEGRLDAVLASGPLPNIAPVVSSEAPLPDEPPRRQMPTWLIVAGIAAAILLVSAAALLFINRDKETASATPTTQTAAGAVQTAVVVPAQTALAAVSTLTVAPLPKVPVVASPAAPAKLPAAPLAAGPLPPINPTTLPDLIATLVQGAAPPGVLQAIGTVLPSLPVGTALPPLPGGTPAPLAIGAKRYGAPALRAPANGSNYQGENATIMLEWAPVQNLGPNDYYRVIVYYKKDGQELAGGTWLKGTSYRVPTWFLAQQSGRFEWQVVVVEANESPEKGGKLGAAVSEPSERRWFEWQPGDSGAPSGPAPTPTYGG
jgi:hypothetical protein